MEDNSMARRSFMKYSLAATAGSTMMAAAVPTANADTPKRKWYKALKIGMLGKGPDAERFALAKRCGWEGIDGSPMADLDAAKQQAELARKAGVPIHGIVAGGWHAPLSSADPKIIEQGLNDMEIALRHANTIDATTVLLVPAVVKEDVSYKQAWERSQKHVRELIPLAEELEVVIAIENVWNKFLLSPLEFAEYIDQFDSPWVRAYCDVGNMIQFGYAQDWIRTLGSRIIKLDLKDFSRKHNKFVNLGDGDVNWPEVRKALIEIGFEGWMTSEVGGGNEAYLTDMVERIDKLLLT